MMTHNEHATSILAFVEDLKEIKGYKDLTKTELIDLAIKLCFLKTLDGFFLLINTDKTLTSIDQTISFKD